MLYMRNLLFAVTMALCASLSANAQDVQADSAATRVIREYVRFMRVFKVTVDHTPDRSIPGTRYHRYDLYSMLSVKDIIYAISSADLYRVYLV